MCNIAGYIGNRPAAPILIEMMKKQEGFGGGFYTGISTISDGKLYHAKVVGDLDKLLSETDALSFPGSIGFLHSRSNSGGGVAWGHPFISCGGKMAYIANGEAGIYRDHPLKNEFGRIAEELENKGYVFETKTMGLVGKYVMLSDGCSIHVSDEMCQLIASFIDDGKTHADAMTNAFMTLPSEIVGLMIHTDIPDRIIASRINMPMMLGRGENETFMATAALSFPDDVHYKQIISLPVASTTEVFNNECKVYKHSPAIDHVSDIPIKLWHDIYERTEKSLIGRSNEPKGVGDIKTICEDLWPTEHLGQANHIVYEILRSFKLENRLNVVHIPVSGAQDGIIAHRFKVYLNP